ncbi:MAG TPA: universal stress protein [Rhizomicrobium sp.]|nr:universal stress protein [Rhizomicrobium sp.]
MKRILVAMDSSDYSQRALDMALDLAAQSSAELHVLHVLQLAFDNSQEIFARIENMSIGDLVEREGANVLARARQRAAEKGGRSINAVTVKGEPAEAILDYARNCSADLIVLGKRGRGRLAGLLLGSISQKVASLGDRPILIVP